MSDNVGLWLTVVGLATALIIIALVYGVMAIGNRMTFPQARARIEQLRTDIQRVSPQTAEDVYGQATAINQEIRDHQTCNQLWWCDPTEPDAWNEVRLIEIPSK